MESYERPEKRRKLDEVHGVPGTINNQSPHGLPLKELKKNGPIVLVNKLNVNHDVIERLRRITKMCGKKVTAGKVESQKKVIELDVSKKNGKEMTNGNYNGKGEESSPQENGRNESSDKGSEQGLPPLQNGVKRVETRPVENGNKVEDGDDKVEQTAADVHIFKQVLKEIIEQRTKVVEEIVAANSLKLQNRIRELERENRELQWNARKVFSAFRQLLIENEKRKQPRTSRGVQVNSIESTPEQEVPTSNFIQVPQTTSVIESSVHITTSQAYPSTTPASTTVAHLTSLPVNVVTSAKDLALSPSFQKSTVPQPYLQTTPRVMFHSQHTSTEQSGSTAVVYTVKPRPTQLTEQHNGNTAQNPFHVSRSSGNESNTTFLQGRTEQSAGPLTSTSFRQSPQVEQQTSLQGLSDKIISPSQTKSTLELIHENQQKLHQQTQRLQQQKQQPDQQQKLQQQRISRPLVQSPQRHPSEATASFLQQLQRQQQLQQQQQHYQKLTQQQQKSQSRHLSTPSSQITEQVPPILSVSPSAQRPRDHSPQYQERLQSVGPSGLYQERRQLVGSPVPSSLPQRNNSAIYQGPSPGHVHSSVHSQPTTVSNPSHSPVIFNTKQIDDVLKRDEATLSSTSKSQIYVPPSQHESRSHSTSSKQIPFSIQRPNLAKNSPVQNHGRLVSPAQPAAVEIKENLSVGGQWNTSFQRQESSQDVSTIQFKKSYPGQTLHTRTELVATHRYHSRPTSDGLQQYVQHPNTQLQQGDRQLRQPPFVSTQIHNTTETRQEEETPSTLSTAVVTTNKPIQTDVKNMQQSILVPARKKHTCEELLPSGYRFSLPSPEYLLHRQRLQQQTQNRTQPQNPQISQVSKAQSLKNICSTERVIVPSTQTSGDAEVIYTTQSPDVHTTAIKTQSFLHNAQRVKVPSQMHPKEVLNPSGYRASSENLLSQKKREGLQVEHLRQSHFNQIQKPPQGQEEVNVPSVTREGGNHLINLQSLRRPPIQSPGISSSDPRNEKHPRDAERTSVSNVPTVRNSLNDQRDAPKPLPKPSASIAVMEKGIVLSWNMEYDDASIKIDNYELFACQDLDESKGQPIKWKKIGIVKALPLPMACTLTQFSSGSKYFFSVRAVDEKERAGPFSDPCTVSLNPL